METNKPKTPNAFLAGIGFTAVTTVLWGMLPILMEIALGGFTSGTIVCFRFFFAFFVLLGILKFRREAPERLLLRPPWLGLVAGGLLAGNYYYFLEGINLSSPSNAAVLIQTAPVLVVLAGVLIFGERFNRVQTMGLAVAGIGFILFFRERNAAAVDPGIFLLAQGAIVLAGVLWAAYMTLLKHLQTRHKAQHLNLLVYGTACLILLVVLDPGELAQASPGGWVLLVILGINTLLAYGCLAEAVKRIPLSLISVIVALNPFITMALMQVLPGMAPQWLAAETISLQGYVGAGIAIGGVVLVIGQYRES